MLGPFNSVSNGQVIISFKKKKSFPVTILFPEKESERKMPHLKWTHSDPLLYPVRNCFLLTLCSGPDPGITAQAKSLPSGCLGRDERAGSHIRG